MKELSQKFLLSFLFFLAQRAVLYFQSAQPQAIRAVQPNTILLRKELQ